ncbi:glycosyltransferase [Ferruginibacter paludis]|uniref:glycosyltransferase family 2 protein n=1 Tax=Ferruginibacter paludis TaxID=1310417 RepID=UPI0025B3ABF9|nr:glycosyltransferase [Ferruginibacter paludis]MDN3658331.1 glycosyltransferase [Ferruginibacter paludis]
MTNPFFSIVIPTYNRAHLIGKTINSVLQQRYTNFEIIIVDDGSTDDTKNAIKSFLSERVTYFKKDNAERSAARNFGTGKAKGDYISWFDSDDLMLPNHLEEAVKMIQRNNQPEIFALSFTIATPELKTVREVILPATFCNAILYKQNILACNPVFVRKDIALHFPFNETRSLSASEDYELWLRMAAKFTIYTSQQPTSILIEHTERSVNVAASGEKIVTRFETFLKIVLANNSVVSFLNHKKADFTARIYLLIATTLAVNSLKKDASKYFLKSLSTCPLIILQRQFYVFLKVMLLKK